IRWSRSSPTPERATSRSCSTPLSSNRKACRSPTGSASALDDHHVEVGGAQAMFARPLVFRRVIELLRRLDVLELVHHDALERNVAFERRLRAAAHHEAAAVLGARGPRPFHI